MFTIYTAYDLAKYQVILGNVKHQQELSEYVFTQDDRADKPNIFNRFITGLRSLMGLRLDYNAG